LADEIDGEELPAERFGNRLPHGRRKAFLLPIVTYPIADLRHKIAADAGGHERQGGRAVAGVMQSNGLAHHGELLLPEQRHLREGLPLRRKLKTPGRPALAGVSLIGWCFMKASGGVP
jgi:hypothetical protein